MKHEWNSETIWPGKRGTKIIMSRGINENEWFAACAAITKRSNEYSTCLEFS